MILAQLTSISLLLAALSLVDQSSAQFWKNDKIVKQWQAATTGNDGAAVGDKSNGGMNSLASSYMNAFVPAAINSGLGSLIGSYQDTSKDSSALPSSAVAASSAKDDYSKTYAAAGAASVPSSAAATYEHAPSLKQPQPQPNYAPAYPSYDNYNKYPASSYEYKQPSYGSHESYSKPSYGYESSHEYSKPSYGSHESYSKPSYGSHEYKQPEYKQPEYKQPEYKQPEYKQPEYKQPEYKQPEYPSKPSYGSHETYKQPEYPSKPSYGSHESSYSKPSYGSHDSYQAVLPPSILPQGAYPIHQPTITNTGETIIENLVGGIPFDCRGRSTGHWRDNKYCDIFHACVFGIQRKTYVCPYVGERTYFDETTRRCEFVYRNPHGCGSNNYYH